MRTCPLAAGAIKLGVKCSAHSVRCEYARVACLFFQFFNLIQTLQNVIIHNYHSELWIRSQNCKFFTWRWSYKAYKHIKENTLECLFESGEIEIRASEIRVIIKYLKNGKAVYVVCTTAEMLKSGGQYLYGR